MLKYNNYLYLKQDKIGGNVMKKQSSIWKNILMIFLGMIILVFGVADCILLSNKSSIDEPKVVVKKDVQKQNGDGDTEQTEELYVKETSMDGITIGDTTESNVTKEGEESEYVFPDSDSTYLTEDDVAGLSELDAKHALNELYARYGRKFDSEELQEYFGSKSWYTPLYSPEEFDDSVLNEYEEANRDLIVEYMESMGWR